MRNTTLGRKTVWIGLLVNLSLIGSLQKTDPGSHQRCFCVSTVDSYSYFCTVTKSHIGDFVSGIRFVPFGSLFSVCLPAISRWCLYTSWVSEIRLLSFYCLLDLWIWLADAPIGTGFPESVSFRLIGCYVSSYVRPTSTSKPLPVHAP